MDAESGAESGAAGGPTFISVPVPAHSQDPHSPPSSSSSSSPFPVSSMIEESGWTRVHWLVFASFSIGLILEGYSFALSSAASTWFQLPVYLRVLSVAWASLWLAAGVMIFGPVTDRIGRRSTFFISMAIFVAAGVLLMISWNYASALMAIGLLTFAGGAEQNVIMTAMHEYYPRRYRSRAYMVTLDTIELGSIASGIVGFYSFSQSPAFSREVAGIIVLAVMALLVLIRLSMPESVRWLEARGRRIAAESVAERFYRVGAAGTDGAVPARGVRGPSRGSLAFRFLVSLVLAGANTVTYGLVTYTLGPIFYPHLVPWILVVGSSAAFAGGLIGLGADRWSRRRLIVYSYALSLASFLLLYALEPIWVRSPPVFWALLILAEVWPQLAWESADALKSEVWPTWRRGTLVGLNRGAVFLLSIPFLYLGSMLDLQQYMLLNVLWWVAGLAAAVAWYRWGVESGMSVSVGVPSGELVQAPAPVPARARAPPLSS
ncbi:MAG: MFS transporter [Conexivisphaera sp.]